MSFGEFHTGKYLRVVDESSVEEEIKKKKGEKESGGKLHSYFKKKKWRSLSGTRRKLRAGDQSHGKSVAFSTSGTVMEVRERIVVHKNS